MENILGWFLLSLALVAPVLIIWSAVKLVKQHKRRQEKATQDFLDQMSKRAEENRQREFTRAKARAERLNLKQPVPPATSSGFEMAGMMSKHVATPRNELPIGSKYVRPVATPSATTSTSSSSNDSLLSDMATMYVINSVLNSSSSSSHRAVDYDTDSVKTETRSSSSSSSWGLDDDDSRKSSYSSFSSSDSSSSWSDSSSSSSDSGPSSDW